MPQKESVLTNIHTVYIPKVYLISELINKSKLKMKKELQDMDIVAEGVPKFYNVQLDIINTKAIRFHRNQKLLMILNLKMNGHYVKMGICTS